MTCAIHLDGQVAALSEGIMRHQMEFDEKAQSLSAMVSRVHSRVWCVLSFCKTIDEPRNGMPAQRKACLSAIS